MSNIHLGVIVSIAIPGYKRTIEIKMQLFGAKQKSLNTFHKHLFNLCLGKVKPNVNAIEEKSCSKLLNARTSRRNDFGPRISVSTVGCCITFA